MSDKKNQTDLLKLQISLSIWNVTDRFSGPTVYVFLTVFQHILYVCLSVCVWLWQGSFQTPQTLMNGSLYVRACVLTVCVWSTVTFAHSFSHQCKIFSPSEHRSFLSSPHHPTNTYTDSMLSAWCRSVTIATLISCELCDSPELVISPARRPHSCHAMDHFWPRTSSTTGSFSWLTPTDERQSAQPPDTRPWLNINRDPSYCGYPD